MSLSLSFFARQPQNDSLLTFENYDTDDTIYRSIYVTMCYYAWTDRQASLDILAHIFTQCTLNCLNRRLNNFIRSFRNIKHVINCLLKVLK